MAVRFRSTKTYGREIGLSCAFRQWRAESHCRLIHGYAIAVHLEFEADALDENHWVVDFGALRSFRAILEDQFDHVLLVAEDDPERGWFEEAHARGIARVRVVPATGCERFAEMILAEAGNWLRDNGYAPRVRIARVEVREHGANSAIATETDR